VPLQPSVAKLKVAILDAGDERGPLTARESKDGTVRVLGVAHRDSVANWGYLYTLPSIAMPAALP
jgi:hypothetical protein